MVSSDYINYAIRPNKAVERKLIFEVLSVLSPVLNLPGYRYIGLGAPWFVDFVMAHRYLLIEDMISIEQDEILASRAEFNKPYACVSVIHGRQPDSAVRPRSGKAASSGLARLRFQPGRPGIRGLVHALPQSAGWQHYRSDRQCTPWQLAHPR